jgi:acetoin utilization deacetylase AcuC-like enzyme
MLKIAYAPIYKLDLPDKHRFPMLKYELIGEQLLYEGAIREEQLFLPPLLDPDIMRLTHTPQYVERLLNVDLTPKEIRAIGFPLSQTLIDRTRCISAGTVQCALYALEYGTAMNAAGGTHHAFTDHGEGFCVTNDIAQAANYLIVKGLRKRILVVDLDVHQGNGTAEIFQKTPQKWSDTEGGVFTFSVHGANNYPLRKEVSDLDMPLPDGVEDAFYLKNVGETLEKLMDKVQPDFVFFNSGVDVLATDKLGKLKLSTEGCRQRDRLVMHLCKRHHIPLSISMGGGYSERVATIVEAHCNTFRSALDIFF